MKLSAVMFDLDGTLLNTLADIAAAANHALTTLGRTPIDVPSYRRLVGYGAHWLLSQALRTKDEVEITHGLALFKSYYAEHGLDLTSLYPGVPELLDELARRGVTMAVLSNKPDAATVRVVSQLLSRWSFHKVMGHREGAPLKPDPTSALHIAAQLDVPAQRWLYLGDSETDMQTATAAGMFAVGATWGYRDEVELRAHGAQRIIHAPTALLDLL